MIDTKGYVRVAEAAERLKLSPEQVRRRLRCGTLKGQRVGNQWFVEEDALRNNESEFRPLIPPSVIAEVKRLRQEITERNGGKMFDAVEAVRKSRESH